MNQFRTLPPKGGGVFLIRVPESDSAILNERVDHERSSAADGSFDGKIGSADGDSGSG